MKHIATAGFWRAYAALRTDTRKIADKNFELLKANPRHPSLQLKKVGDLWSARVGRDFRALAIDHEAGLAWIWIGAHDEYERMINRF